MRFPCQPVDEKFFDVAPLKWVNTVEVDAPADRIFAMFEDGASWPVWFKGINNVTWHSPKPFGVGTTRTVALDLITVDEHFFRWEQNRRFSFYVTAASLPLTHVLAEDYLLEDLGAGRTRFTYTVAAKPTWLLTLGGPLARWNFGRMFKGAALGMVREAPGYKG